MSMGFTFGNVKLYQSRKYYRKWLENSLLEASKLPDNIPDMRLIMEFRGKLDAPSVIDDGILPCSIYQKHEDVSRSDHKMACFVVFLRHLVQSWHEYNADDPQKIEPLLIRLDSLIENWDDTKVIGHELTGYHLCTLVDPKL